MPTLTANKETVSVFRTIRAELVSHLTQLAEITKDYPVVCTFAGHRYVFESEADIRRLIEEIQSAVDRYDKQQLAH
ncbi:MAG: hypothetical protein K8T25_00450 [Planctomycetia bacterium]|nr:hypothetical protein [Planctomycetia bacterium]